MPTKVVIIDVDLGVSVADIIKENVTELTTQTKTDLTTAIETAKAVQRVKLEREQKINTITQQLSAAMDDAYNQLVTASTTGLPVTTIMALVSPHVPNSSAFTTRMKHILSQKGNPYALGRIKHLGVPHYRFTPYNLSPSEPTDNHPIA